jgi:hypothetical protein
MDPFGALPIELSEKVLLLVEGDVAYRPLAIPTALLASKRWYAVAMQPELWRDIEMRLPVFPSKDAEGQAALFLQRAQGGLRTLRLTCSLCSFFLSLWNVAVQEASSRGTLARVAFNAVGSERE